MSEPNLQRSTYDMKIFDDVIYNTEHKIIFYPSGNKKREEFYVNDKLHFERKFFPKDDKCSVFSFRPKNVAVIEYYDSTNEREYHIERWLNGKQLPISDDTYINKFTLIKREWRLNDKLHNEDGPAIIEYFHADSYEPDAWYPSVDLVKQYDENVIKSAWCINGNLHRLDGPAYIEYYIEGGIKAELWYRNGKLHRSDGPAVVRYPNRNVPKDEYWSDGVPSEPQRVPGEPQRVPSEPQRVPSEPQRVPSEPQRVPSEPQP